MLRPLAKKLLALLPTATAAALKAQANTLLDRLALRRAAAYDRRNYATASGLLRQHRHRTSLEANIIKTYHRIEKGLALAYPRPGFGRDAVDLLLDCCEKYLALFGSSATLERALNALDEYVAFNVAQQQTLPWLVPRLASLRQRCGAQGANGEGGTVQVSRAAIHRAALMDLRPFFQQRYSVRQFAARPVEPALVEAAVRMAQKTPSVCNRESGTVHAVFDPALMARVLAHQNGNRGFGDQAGCVLVVTARLDTFLSVGERYQGWIDGGMFAMSLIYALHSLGLGSCCLNWSVEPPADRALKATAGIPADELVIMLLAVGHLPEQFRVAQSPRRPLSEVLRVH